ncbi:MAG: type I restriction endonuclease subunit R, partial [Chitinophagia bacterium]|nr:type I restriction endonuclease subunit R [Chitinophagia bacterium]
MVSKTNEQALEAAIEKALTGTCLEELSGGVSMVAEPQGMASEPVELYRGGNGFYIGNPTDYNTQYAIDELRFWHFLENTQKEEFDKLKRSSDWKLKVLERLDRMIKKYGLLRLFRKGLEVEDAHFTLLFQVPMASSSQAV